MDVLDDLFYYCDLLSREDILPKLNITVDTTGLRVCEEENRELRESGSEIGGG